MSLANPIIYYFGALIFCYAVAAIYYTYQIMKKQPINRSAIKTLFLYIYYK